MRVECDRAGRSAYFATLEPLLFRDAEADEREVGRLLGLEGTGVRSALLRLRTRLRYLVLDEVRRTVADPTETADELRYLIELLGR
jgi:hypothetical protein